MDKNTQTHVSSVVRNNPFTQRFTCLSLPTVWLEASENTETHSWSVHAMGTSERDRNNGFQNLTPAFQNNIPGIMKRSRLPSMNNRSEHNNFRITSYETNLLATSLSEREALAYLVFFEINNHNSKPQFYNKDKVDFETLSILTRREKSYHANKRKKRFKTIQP